MAGTDDSMAKICQMCGTDCTDKPRVKDPKGGYYCKACADKLVAQKGAKPGASAPAKAGAPTAKPAAKAPAAASENNIMAKLMEQSLAESAGTCPACRKKIAAGALICVNCGFNVTTGQMTHTAVQRAPAAAEKKTKKPRK